jgi:hypothetical protein
MPVYAYARGKAFEAALNTAMQPISLVAADTIQLRGRRISSVSDAAGPEKLDGNTEASSWLALTSRKFGNTYPHRSSHMLHAFFCTVMWEYDSKVGTRLLDSPTRFEIAHDFWRFMRQRNFATLALMELVGNPSHRTAIE